MKPGEKWEARLAELQRCLQLLLPTLLAGLALGIGLWWATHYGHRGYFRTNKLAVPLREVAGGFAGAAALCAAGLHTAWAWRLGQNGGTPFSTQLAQVSQRIGPWRLLSYSIPLLAFCSSPHVEAKSPGLLLLAAMGLSALVATGVYQLSCRVRFTAKLSDKTGNYLALAALLVGCVAYGYRLSLASIAVHRRLRSHMDLAVYENVLWKTSHGDFLGCSICKGGTHASSHFDPILGFLAPIYRLFPETSTLLIAQSVWLAVGAIPLYGLALHQLRSRLAALAIAFCYLLAPSLHGANLFGFHSLVLCAPLLLSALYCFERKQTWRYWLCVGLLLLVREDMALVASGLGLYAFFSGRRLQGLATLALGAVYLMAVKAWFMADSGLIMQSTSSTVSFAHYFRQLMPNADEGGLGLITSLLSNPVYVLKAVLREDKIRFFCLLLAPLMWLPLLAPRRLWVCLWGLVFVGLASRKPVFTPHFQYSVLLLPGLVASMPAALQRLTKSRFFSDKHQHRGLLALAGASLLCSLVLSAEFGALHKNDALRGGWAKPQWNFDLRGSKRYREVKKMAKGIPKGSTVAATRGLLSYVADRGGLSKRLDKAQFVLVDRKNFGASRVKAWRNAKQQWTFQKLKSYDGIELHQRLQKRPATSP